jgi:hypothetical protein
MKAIILLSSLCLVTHTAAAATWTVNNQPGAPADFTSLSSAVNAAASGDTLYVQPSPESYGNFSLSKQLYILGPGHKPEFTPFSAQIQTVTLYSSSSGSILKGMRISYVTNAAGTVASNILFSGNYIANQIPVNLNSATLSNFIFEENIIAIQSNSLNVPALVNATFRNNIFWSFLSDGQAFSNLSNALVDHNLFIQTNSSNSNSLHTGGINVTHSNNIILRVAQNQGTALEASCNGCSWTNNLTYAPSLTLSNLPGTNFNNQQVQFVNASPSDPAFSYDKNYRLAPQSAGVAAATDGTDLGPYGGILEFSEFGYDDGLPRIGSFTLQSATAPQGGTLTIQLRAYGSGQE